MAKTSMVNRDIKRTKLVKKYAAKRGELKTIVLSTTASYEEKMAAQTKLQKLPRDASPVRQRTRCALTATSCVKQPCAVTCRVCARPAGNNRFRAGCRKATRCKTMICRAGL